jgi:hypothetical protein
MYFRRHVEQIPIVGESPTIMLAVGLSANSELIKKVTIFEPKMAIDKNRLKSIESMCELQKLH